VNLLSWAPLAIAAGLIAAAAAFDIARRKIPNWAVIALVATWIVAAIAGQAPTSLLSGAAAAAIGLAATFALYWLGILGAGDAKLFAAAALFVGLGHLLAFAVLTALSGGLLAIFFLILSPGKVLRGLTRQGRAENKGRGIPYGVAIALGAFATVALSPGLQPV
jgi:prepilin peptidase CpaA